MTQVGLWGCGNMGNSLARALMATGQARLAVAYDVQAKAASELANRYGAQVADSVAVLLSYPALDGVIIAVPPYLHEKAVTQAAQAGIDIFVEKPMAVDVAACQRMISAVEHCGVKLMVGQVLRYYEPYRSILRWQREGRYGEMYAASIWRIVDGRKLTADGSWRASRAKSGGYLLEVGAHELDMLRCLLGQPQTVYAVSQKVLPREHELADYIALQIRFAQGKAAAYEGGTGSRVARYGFRFYFEKATLLSDSAFDRQALQAYGTDGQALGLPAAEFSPDHPVAAELADWLSALREQVPIPIPGREGLATVALAEAAYRSAETGQVEAYDKHIATDFSHAQTKAER